MKKRAPGKISPYWQTWISADGKPCPTMPNHARRIDVNGIRSELGNTRLSKDDGSIHKANSLKSTFLKPVGENHGVKYHKH